MNNVNLNPNFRFRCKPKSILLALALMVASSPVFSQNKTVTLKKNNMLMKDAIYQIEKQTNYLFIYDNSVINPNKTINIDFKKEKLEDALAKLFSGTDVKYVIENRNILLLKNNQPINNTTSQNQEKIAVRGRITDKNGQSVVGVTVAELGTNNTRISDQNGNYSINVNPEGTLAFRFQGYQTVVKPVNGLAVHNITFTDDISELDEVVVIGYTSQKKSLVTGSVATMKMNEDLMTLPTTSAGNLLVGQLPGVNVSTPNSVPGNQPSVSIRTGSSINGQPITYVIDGVVRGGGDFNNLSPNEIEDITVLKDAASAAIYGSRSAGGVILVTTKRGNLGKPMFNYSFANSVDTRTKNVDLTSAVQAGELYTRINGSSDPAGWAWSQEEIDHFKTINNGWGYDQLETVWQNPSTQTHNLSVNGGSDRVRYFGAGSFVKQQGFMDPMTYDKYNFRMNVTADISKDLEVFTGLALYNNFTGNLIDGGDTYGKLRIWQPDQPVYTNSGKYIDYGWIGNVGARVDGASGYNTSSMLKPQLIISGTYKAPFLQGLSAKVSYNRSWTNDLNKVFYTNYDMMVMKKTGINNRIMSTDDADIVVIKRSTCVGKDYIQRKSSYSDDKQFNVQLNYQNTFNDVHEVSAALVSEWYEGAGSGVLGGRETFPVYRTDQFWAASGARADTWGDGDTDWVSGRMSYIGQFNYNYASKYLFNFSFREDGSMNFAPENRWGFFPAGSVGWVMTEEKFFNVPAIQFLKLRASVGLTGNDAVGGWQWQESYRSGSSAYFGTTPVQSVGITYGNVVNRNLTWEKALSYNFGVDMNFLKNWNLSADYWFRNSYDILGNRQSTLPSTFSLTMPAENYAQIEAQGVDFQIGYNKATENVSYHGNLTMSYGWNKVVKMDYAENAQWLDIPVDKSMNYIKGLAFDKILRTQEEVDAFVAANPNYKHSGLSPELGMMVYKDITGPDGQADGIIDNWDRVMLKSNNFPIVYGLNLGGSWKGFRLDMMFSGRLLEKKFMSDLAGGVEWNRMWNAWYDDSWTADNPNASLPKRISNNSPKTYNNNSDFWLKNGSFVRLKYLTLSYDLPKGNFYNKVFDNIRIFASGTNLFVLSKFNQYYDVEISGGNAFPVLRSYNVGIDVKF